jgi:putative heme iron utilization protein
MDAMSTDAEIQRILRDLFHLQRFAVLATDDHGQPYTSLMAFAASADLRQLVVLSDRTTCKFANLMANCRVALLIDNRENKDSDPQVSVAVTAIGKAREAGSGEGVPLLELFLARHPYLAEFALSPTSAIVTVKIDSYLLVSSFQKVLEWRIGA